MTHLGAMDLAKAKMRLHVFSELVRTEKEYVRALQRVVEDLLQPVLVP